MPIRPENRGRYPKDWRQIVERVRERSGNQCEWCGARNYEPNPATGKRVVLTTAHLSQPVEDCRMENLAHLCQKCHNAYDAPMRAQTRRETLRRRRLSSQPQLDLPQ